MCSDVFTAGEGRNEAKNGRMAVPTRTHQDPPGPTRTLQDLPYAYRDDGEIFLSFG